MKSFRSLPCVLAAAALVWSLAGCGGSDSTGPSASQLTSAEAIQVASALFTEMSTALASAGFDAAPLANRASFSAGPSTTTINVTGKCTLGGTITATGTFNDNTNSTGTGSYAMTGTYTPHGCVVSTGTRNISIDGDPNITWNYSMNLVAFKQSGDVNWKMNGGFKWSDGSCPINYSMVFSTTGHGSYTGSMCGQSFSTTY